MSEIEKMYKNAGVSCKPNYVYNKVPILSGLKYPPFTAEKQLAILCWFANFYGHITLRNKPKNITAEGLQESLARLINLYWTGLPPEQQQQIKEILE